VTGPAGRSITKRTNDYRQLRLTGAASFHWPADDRLAASQACLTLTQFQSEFPRTWQNLVVSVPCPLPHEDHFNVLRHELLFVNLKNILYKLRTTQDLAFRQILEFGIELPSCLIKKRRDKFLSWFNSVDNVFCRYFCKL